MVTSTGSPTRKVFLRPSSSRGVVTATSNSGSLYSSRRKSRALPIDRRRSLVQKESWYSPRAIDSLSSSRLQALPKALSVSFPSSIFPRGPAISYSTMRSCGVA